MRTSDHEIQSPDGDPALPDQLIDLVFRSPPGPVPDGDLQVHKDAPMIVSLWLSQQNQRSDFSDPAFLLILIIFYLSTLSNLPDLSEASGQASRGPARMPDN